MDSYPTIGCSFYRYSRVLICQSCRYGLHIRDHLRSPVNHFIYYHNADQHFLNMVEEICMELNPANSNNIQQPPPFQPRIPDLELQLGWYCRRPVIANVCGNTIQQQCQYLSISTDHFLRHQTEIHSQNDKRDFVCQKVLMQTLFPNPHQHWFPVTDLEIFDHRPLYTQRPAWRTPLVDTIEKSVISSMTRAYLSNSIGCNADNAPLALESDDDFNTSHAKYVLFLYIIIKTNNIFSEKEFDITSDNLENDDVETFLNKYMGQNCDKGEGFEIIDGVPDTLWLSRTGWTHHFEGHDLHLLALQTELPGKQDENDMDHLFRSIVNAAQEYFARAASVSSSSSHAILRWTRSVTVTDCSPTPFRFVQSPATYQRYTRYWARLLCFLCRSYLPDSASHDLLILNKNQLLCRERLIIEAENYVSSGEESNERLQQSIHQLFLSLIGQYLPESKFESPIIHFLACMGIDINSGTLRLPRTYTPILAGFVYCMRIIVLYEAHEQARQTGTRDILIIFKTMQAQWLTAASEFPFGDILNLLGYGQKCCQEVKKSVIHWTSDAETLVYRGQQLEIENISTMVKELSNVAYSIGLQYFGWSEHDLINLDLHALHDELGNYDAGYSFLHDSRNTGYLNPRQMLNRFLSSDAPSTRLFAYFRSTSGRRKQRYVVLTAFEKLLQAIEIFLEILMVLTQLSCGQPPRGTELFAVLVANTAAHPRNVFLIKGRLTIVTNYNKSQAVIGRENRILRTLPTSLSKLWILYLAFTKPVIWFAEEHVHNQLNISNANTALSTPIGYHTHGLIKSTTPHTTRNLLFHSRQKPWKSGRLSKILVYYSADYLSFDNLCISAYRHIAIAIYRKRIQHVKLVADIRKAGKHTPIAVRQAGHSITTSYRHYANDNDELSSLDSETIELFQAASVEWHQHFHLDTLLLRQIEIPGSIQFRLDPPIGSKVPLRLRPFEQRNLISTTTQHNLNSQPIYRHNNVQLFDHISIILPDGFQRHDYSVFTFVEE